MLPRGRGPLVDVFVHFESPLPATIYHLVLDQVREGQTSVCARVYVARVWRAARVM